MRTTRSTSTSLIAHACRRCDPRRCIISRIDAESSWSRSWRGVSIRSRDTSGL